MPLSASVDITLVATKLVPGKKYRIQEDFDGPDPNIDPDYFLGLNASTANPNGVVRFALIDINTYSGEDTEVGTYNFKVVEDVPGSAVQPPAIDSDGNPCTTKVVID